MHDILDLGIPQRIDVSKLCHSQEGKHFKLLIFLNIPQRFELVVPENQNAFQLWECGKHGKVRYGIALEQIQQFNSIPDVRRQVFQMFLPESVKENGFAWAAQRGIAQYADIGASKTFSVIIISEKTFFEVN